MDLQEAIKNLKERGTNNPLPLSKMAKIWAAGLDQAAVAWGAKVFSDKKFQTLANFKNLEQIEKDRIFNELVIAPLTLFMLTLEASDFGKADDLQDYFLVVKDEIPKAHLESLKDLGIEKKHLDIWKKLIKMRYEEYGQDKLTARGAMLEYNSQEKDLQMEDLKEIHLVLPVFTVAVGCHRHICRGKIEGQDFLFKFLFKKLSRFYFEIRVLLEGGKIDPLTRLKINLRHFWNDLKEGQ